MTAHISEDGLNREESVAEHTRKTTYLCNEKGRRCGLSQVMSLCGIYHDMGKNKHKFDDYIHADRKIKQNLKGTIAHASTGAKYFYDMYHESSGNVKFMVEMVSYAVAAHHGLFDCVEIEGMDIFSRKLDRVEDYDEACSNALQDYLGEYELDRIFLQASEEYDAVWNKIKVIFSRVKLLLRSGYRETERKMLFECKFFLLACLQRLLLSMLIDSDWEATSDFMEHSGFGDAQTDVLPGLEAADTEENSAEDRISAKGEKRVKGENNAGEAFSENGGSGVKSGFSENGKNSAKQMFSENGGIAAKETFIENGGIVAKGGIKVKETFSEKEETSPKEGLGTKEIFEKAKENFAAYMQRKRQSVDISRLTSKEKEIFDARNALQEECRQFAKHPAGIYCLPIPTGGGKTLSSLAYALEYCSLHPETERIIYVSPYISVTEQNAQVFRDAIGNDKWILEHHSSVIRKEGEGSEDYRNSKWSGYDINWEEPFICTTFVQFMNTLFSDRSGSVRRMHRLANSVVIIDEVQSMPLKCIHTFNYMINFLNVVCNTDIILCTATQPTLDEAECPICYSQPKYMIEKVDDCFQTFERVKIHTPEPSEKYTIESLGKEIVQQTEMYQSILVVLNTKSAVRKLYDILKAEDINAVYLTTNLCAEHRSDKVRAIKGILEEKQESIVVVSTNLIEAGVDISFECVYRSMAGLDSLAQTAGRCNRNGELEYGMIYLIMLEGENAGNMEELQQSLRVAERVIGHYNDSGKAGSLLLPRWMDEYYRNLYSGAADKMNFPIEKSEKNIMELLSTGFGTAEKKNSLNQAYKTAGQAYRVIDDYSFGVIVPYGKGKEIIEGIQCTSAMDIAGIKDYVRRAQRYTVNVRGNQIKRFEGLIQPVSDKMPELYMVAAPGAYNSDCGITPEWETLIF